MNEYPMHTIQRARYSLLCALVDGDPRVKEIKAKIYARWPSLKEDFEKLKKNRRGLWTWN